MDPLNAEEAVISVFDTSADLFANSSTETVKSNLEFSQLADTSTNVSRYDNVSSFNSPQLNASSMSNAAQTVLEACNRTNRVYCPFCPFEFNYEFALKEHIKTTHPKELQEVTHSKISPFFPCPFCHAKFYLKELLPKHIFRKHEDSLIGAFSTGSCHEYVQCTFCPHRVLRKHHKLMMIHIEKKHFAEFVKSIEVKYPKTFLSCENLMDELETQPRTRTPSRQSEGVQLKAGTPGLSKQFESLGCDSPSSLTRSILKSPTHSECRNDFSLDGDFNDMTRQIQISNCVRRKLKFDLPDSPEENKENSLLSELKLKFPQENSFSSKFKNLFKHKKSHMKIASSPKKSPKKDNSPGLFMTSSPIPAKGNKKRKMSFLKHDIDLKKDKGVAMLSGYLFKCGLCGDSFETNAHLLNHLHKSHRSIQFKAQYRCGHCDAKFFRNSYLVRHCWYHHTPKCLKSQSARNF